MLTTATTALQEQRGGTMAQGPLNQTQQNIKIVPGGTYKVKQRL